MISEIYYFMANIIFIGIMVWFIVTSARMLYRCGSEHLTLRQEMGWYYYVHVIMSVTCFGVAIWFWLKVFELATS